LTFDGEEYREHAVFHVGDTASSALLSGFQRKVDDVFAKCDEADAEGI